MAGALSLLHNISLLRKAMFCMVFFSFMGFIGRSQEKCLTDIILKKKIQSGQLKEDKLEFENWLSRNKAKLKNQNLRSQNQVVVIPVVIHIIHNGEALGTGSNIPNEQVYNQLLTLNQDFRRLNADASETVNDFQSVAADTQIEFQLAKTDPEGIPTNGIVRVSGYKSIYSDDDDATFKKLSYWPAEDYLNIWVIPMSNNYLGYAQFPVSDLPGLEDAVNNRLTDGVVINYKYFGTGYNALAFSKGRTATHEIGHFLGLRHIWGDGGCNATDYCDDTPPAASSTSGCNIQRVSCGNLNMIQNYMDYSNDVCMNLFTADQAERMNIVLNYSPRRKSLLTSEKENEPTLLANDVGIKTILSPQMGICQDVIYPSVEIRNYGINNLNNIEISLFIDNEPIETISENFVLSSLDTRIIYFSELQLSNKGGFSFHFEILNTDDKASNNQKTANIFLPHVLELPISESFENSTSAWRILNPDNKTTWEETDIDGNKALKINHFEYPEGYGEFDYFISPILDLTNMRSANLEFRVSHSRKPNGVNDGLIVAVSKDCGSTFNIFNPLYEKFGVDLATVSGLSTAFIPSNHLEWRKESVNLNQFVGDSIQIAFISQGGNGNNIYLDDIKLTGKRQYNTDISILSINRHSPLVCNQASIPVFIKNWGLEPIESFRYVLRAGNEIVSEDDFELTEAIPKEGIYSFTIPYSFGEEKVYSFSLSLELPNASADEDSSNNTIDFQLVKNNSQETIPLKQNFSKKESLSGWSLISPSGQENFEILTTANERFWANYHYNSLPNSNKVWLISPSLDLTHLSEASLGFDLSTVYNFNYSDTVRVLVSENCGPFIYSMITESSEALSDQFSLDAWIPNNRKDWEQFIVDLTAFAGKEDIRVAIVVENGQSNNIFIDNINLFTSSSPQIFDRVDYITIYPNPSYDGEVNLVLNLPERQDLILQILDAQGHIIFESNTPNALNQDYVFDMSGQANGLYIVRAYGKNWNQSRKIIIMR